MKVTTLATVAGLALTLSAHANSITLSTMDVSTDSHAVGDCVPGVDYGQFSGSTAGDQAMANQLVTMAINTSFIGIGQSVQGNNVIYNRTGNTFGFASPQTQMPLANLTGAESGGSVSSITLDANGFYYLVAKYDGPNGGAEVWDISGLQKNDTIYLPQNAWGHGMTGYSLLQATPTPVPDGGLTVCMLGLALSSLGLLRKKLN